MRLDLPLTGLLRLDRPLSVIPLLFRTLRGVGDLWPDLLDVRILLRVLLRLSSTVLRFLASLGK